MQLDRASAFVLRDELPTIAGDAKPAGWTGISRQLLESKPRFLQREGEALPAGLVEMVRNAIIATDSHPMHRTGHLRAS